MYEPLKCKHFHCDRVNIFIKRKKDSLGIILAEHLILLFLRLDILFAIM